MPKVLSSHSVGLVQPQILKSDQPFALMGGQVLDAYEIIYETYGQLNLVKTNAILICHALSGHHHAAGYHREDDRRPGWWDSCIGPGKPIDTNLFFVVSLNNLGGCHGSTGPASVNPTTGHFYGADFPVVTVEDWVNSQAQLADHLGIHTWAAVIGGSLGGMQALQWAISFPDRVKRVVCIASAPRLSAQNIAFNEVARQAILTDPDYCEGHFLSKGVYPKRGLMLARMVGHITYLSDDAMGSKFGRDRLMASPQYALSAAEFQVQSYLQHQGDEFSNRFDANTYLLMTKALDYFDPAQTYEGNLAHTFEKIQAKSLVISFSTDWRFSPERSREMVDALVQARKSVSYLEIEASQGHDAFLLPIPRYHTGLRSFLTEIEGV